MTIDPEMLKILQNLEDAHTNVEETKAKRASGQHVVKEDTQEMYNILKKMEDATTKAATKVIKNGEPITTQNSVSMGKYTIVMEKRTLVQGVNKVYYDIKDNNGKIIYPDIALFESAMAVLKGLCTDSKNNSKKIIELDEKYNMYLQEAASHKRRIRKLNEGYKKDVGLAKQSSAMDKASTTKKQIKALI
jgi:hypothetical protein